MMSNEYYDVPITFNAVISVSAKTKREAEERLYSMDNEDLICFIYLLGLLFIVCHIIRWLLRATSPIQ